MSRTKFCPGSQAQLRPVLVFLSTAPSPAHSSSGIRDLRIKLAGMASVPRAIPFLAAQLSPGQSALRLQKGVC